MRPTNDLNITLIPQGQLLSTLLNCGRRDSLMLLATTQDNTGSSVVIEKLIGECCHGSWTAATVGHFTISKAVLQKLRGSLAVLQISLNHIYCLKAISSERLLLLDHNCQPEETIENGTAIATGPGEESKILAFQIPGQ